MITVIFKVTFRDEAGRAEFYRQGGKLAERLKDNGAFLGSANYRSPEDPDTDLCMNFWKNKEALDAWRNDHEHRLRQALGRSRLFTDYTITVCDTLYQYTKENRQSAPEDSNCFHLA